MQSVVDRKLTFLLYTPKTLNIDETCIQAITLVPTQLAWSFEQLTDSSLGHDHVTSQNDEAKPGAVCIPTPDKKRRKNGEKPIAHNNLLKGNSLFCSCPKIFAVIMVHEKLQTVQHTNHE
jgi:hypothetical protein